MPDLTIPQIEEIAARAEKATPGPWAWITCAADTAREVACSDIDGEYVPVFEYGELSEGQIAENFEFSIAARTDIPALCQTALSAIRERDALRAAVEQAPHGKECMMGLVFCIHCSRSLEGHHRKTGACTDLPAYSWKPKIEPCNCWKAAVPRG